MPTFYNDVDGKLEAVLENLLTAQAATTDSNIVSVPIHTGLSASDVVEDPSLLVPEPVTRAKSQFKAKVSIDGVYS